MYFIKFETAKLAKEKGFNELCENYYRPDGYSYNVGVLNSSFRNSKLVNDCTMCTQDELQKWLRETHNILVFNDFELSETKVKDKSYIYIIKGFKCIICKYGIDYDQGDEVNTD